MTDTLKKITEQYLAHLKEQGKSTMTLYTYGMDLACLVKFFGEEQDLDKITPAMVGKFLKSEILLNNSRSNRPRSDITINKNIRVMRQFFIWAHDTGRMASLPLPKTVPMGHQVTELAERA